LGKSRLQFGVLRRLGLILLLFVLLASAGATRAGADPNDQFWPLEWGPVLTRASDLWQYTTGDPSIVIAVVDTGLSPTPQPDMTHVVPGWDILGADTNTADTFGHGTWVSTLIGAQGNNNVGIAGYCWACSIMPVRVAAGREGTVSGNITSGIRWAVDHGARIINVSLASNEADINEYGAVEYALDHGVLIVASAGNGGNTNLLYPAADGTTLANVLSVAGTDQNDQLYSWASRGPSVALSAPGCAEFLDPWVGPASACGSSFAPPAVTGIAGLLLSLRPGLTMYQIVAALKATAHPVSGIAGGRVDAWAAAHYLGLVPENPPPPPTPVRTPPFVSPQVLVSTGSIRRSAAIQLPLSPGQLVLQLFGPAAQDCTMSVRIGGTLYVDLAAERTVHTLSATIRKGGTYVVNVHCASVNRKRYELTASGIFSR
jgi:Subtilase family